MLDHDQAQSIAEKTILDYLLAMHVASPHETALAMTGLLSFAAGYLAEHVGQLELIRVMTVLTMHFGDTDCFIVKMPETPDMKEIH